MIAENKMNQGLRIDFASVVQSSFFFSFNVSKLIPLVQHRQQTSGAKERQPQLKKVGLQEIHRAKIVTFDRKDSEIGKNIRIATKKVQTCVNYTVVRTQVNYIAQVSQNL